MASCITCGSFEEDFLAQLAVTAIPSDGKTYITGRYLSLVKSAHMNYITVNLMYHVLINLITVLGVALTTFGAILNATDINVNESVVRWALVLIPPFIIVFNKVLYIADAPKMRVVYEALREKLKFEGYSLLFSVGAYAGDISTEEQMKLFVMRVENIKSKTVNVGEKDGSAVASEVLAFASGKKQSNSLPARSDRSGDANDSTHGNTHDSIMVMNDVV